MINRDTLVNTDPATLFGELAGEVYMTDEQLKASVQKTLAERSGNEPVWIFAYGSLIWNPVMKFTEKQVGFLKGYSRAFCMKLTIGRGSVSTPGRMLALIPGKGVQGLVFRLNEHEVIEELELLWRREMRASSYHPVWAEASLNDGTVVKALTFVMSDKQIRYDPVIDPEYVAKFIFSAKGPLGSNKEYLDNLVSALAQENIADDYIMNVYKTTESLSIKTTKNGHIKCNKKAEE